MNAADRQSQRAPAARENAREQLALTRQNRKCREARRQIVPFRPDRDIQAGDPVAVRH